LFVTERAHLIAAFSVYALADAFLIEVDRTEWPGLRAHLEKFLVADDVEFEELTRLTVIDIEGPQAAAVLARIIGDTPEPWRIDEARMIASIPRIGLPAFTLLSETEAADGLLQLFEAAGARPISNTEALEIIRIENGIARVGVDTSDKTLALEARLEPAISLRKGCYIGQETLERATARGGIKKRLFGLRIADGARLDSGAAIMLGEKPAGTLTSFAQSPQFGLIGLAILHHSAWNEGTGVKIHSGGELIEASVTDLPFKNP
jgi:folate-binding protein YgfZ